MLMRGCSPVGSCKRNGQLLFLTYWLSSILSFFTLHLQFATAGDDNTVKIWDLRKQKAIYTIPASNSVVPDVRYDQTGEFLATCSFDHTVRGNTIEYELIVQYGQHEIINV